MKLDPSAIESPLALIALFVAIIELFLLYPIAKLEGRDRSLIIIFVIAYPVFIAGSFFVFLWNKPVNLYQPQTLSENLQQALLPEKLNNQLAPDRAAISAVELKISSLENQLRSVLLQVNTAGSDVAKRSDLEALKSELLARAKAAGDVSPTGLASAAKEIKSEAEKEIKDRVALARTKVEEFATWLQKKGLKPRPPLPQLANTSSGLGLTINVSDNTIELGSPAEDYRAPGLYVYPVAYAQKALPPSFVRTEPGYGNVPRSFVYIVLEYLACGFANMEFPNQSLLYQNLKTSEKYDYIFKLLSELSEKTSRGQLEAALVRMFNDWNVNSDLASSLRSIEAALVESGVQAGKISHSFEEFRKRAT